MPSSAAYDRPRWHWQHQIARRMPGMISATIDCYTGNCSHCHKIGIVSSGGVRKRNSFLKNLECVGASVPKGRSCQGFEMHARGRNVQKSVQKRAAVTKRQCTFQVQAAPLTHCCKEVQTRKGREISEVSADPQVNRKKLSAQRRL